MTAPRPSPRPSPRPRPPAPAPAPAPAKPPRRGPRARLRTAWAEADARVTAREEPQRARRFEPPIDPTSWSGALIVMTLITAALWAVQIVDSHSDLHLTRFGLRPRTVRGLRGIGLGPFVQGSEHQMLSVTVPLLAIGWVVLLAGARVWLLVTVTVIAVGGALTWVVGPAHVDVVGAGVVIFGWLGYLIARAVFSRSFKWIAVAAIVVGFFSTLLFGVFSTSNSLVSWESHICGLVAGLAVGAALHPRGTQLRQFRGATRARRRNAADRAS